MKEAFFFLERDAKREVNIVNLDCIAWEAGNDEISWVCYFKKKKKLLIKTFFKSRLTTHFFSAMDDQN